MNPYLEPQGFLGTGASLLADVTLIAYLLLILPGMIGGYVLAKKGLHRPHHKWLMIAVTAVNWFFIVFLMLAAYRFDVIDNILSQPGNARYLMPTIHGLLGLPAQLLATYIVIRMQIEDTNVARAKARGERNTSKYWYTGAKPAMRLTLVLWLATTVLGVMNYLIRYEVLPTSAAGSADAPIATPEVTPEMAVPIIVIVTEEASADATQVQPPAATPQVDSQGDAPLVAPPAETPEVVPPAVTPEVEDDGGQGRGRGRGRGRGGDEDEGEEEDDD